MTPLQIGLMVLGNLAIVALALIAVRSVLKRVPGKLRTELEASGQKLVRGPEEASYQGATAEYGRVRGNGAAALTETQLVFRPLIGKRIEVPLDQLTAVREDKWFMRGYRSGRLHLILKTKSGTEVAFMFQDHAGWMATFRTMISSPVS